MAFQATTMHENDALEPGWAETPLLVAGYMFRVPGSEFQVSICGTPVGAALSI